MIPGYTDPGVQGITTATGGGVKSYPPEYEVTSSSHHDYTVQRTLCDIHGTTYSVDPYHSLGVPVVGLTHLNTMSITNPCLKVYVRAYQLSATHSLQEASAQLYACQLASSTSEAPTPRYAYHDI